MLKHIGTKGLSIQELMIRVRKSVMEETKNGQVPWEEAALNESFFFVPSATPSSTPSPSQKSGDRSGDRKPGGRPANTNLPPNVGVGIGTGM